jgi:ATP-dependent DNA helicase MPH1
MIRCQPFSNESQVYIKKCAAAGLLYGNLDPVMFHPYRANLAMSEATKRPDARQLQWVYPVLLKVSALARAMGYLVRETVFSCDSMLMSPS